MHACIRYLYNAYTYTHTCNKVHQYIMPICIRLHKHSHACKSHTKYNPPSIHAYCMHIHIHAHTPTTRATLISSSCCNYAYLRVCLCIAFYVIIRSSAYRNTQTNPTNPPITHFLLELHLRIFKDVPLRRHLRDNPRQRREIRRVQDLIQRLQHRFCVLGAKFECVTLDCGARALD